MPVKISLVDHAATGWKKSKATTPEELLQSTSPKHYRRCQKLIQSAFTCSDFGASHVSGSENGFVWAAYHAYSTHHHLVIRPEDVWFAILTQMSFFVNANAEELRSFFVDHQGRKELEAISSVADFAALAMQMTHLIAKNVVDPELREWVMPSFTTTTYSDKVVGAILFMGAMQKYFSYKMTVCCGLPSVTLLGEVDDWRKILTRLDKIDLLGEEPRQFARMLRPIVRHMVLSFEDPTSVEVSNFWNTMVHETHLFSGTNYLSGWLTAFCFWSEAGKAKSLHRSCDPSNSQFGDVEFPTVDIDDVPVGIASVPVKVDDNGNKYDATMVAGSVGIAALLSSTPSFPEVEAVDASNTSSGTPNQTTTDVDSDAAIRDTVQPVSGWWMYQNEAPEEAASRETEKVRLRDEVKKLSAGLIDAGIGSAHWNDYLTKSRQLSQLEAY